MTTKQWSEATKGEKAYYLAFSSRVFETREVPEPLDNDIIGNKWLTPTEGEQSAVQETGDMLVRTINYKLNNNQSNALRLWLKENPDKIIKLEETMDSPQPVKQQEK